MLTIKKVWLTDHDPGLWSMTIESKNADLINGGKVCVTENSFPNVPTPENPKRHVIVLSLFDDEDLLKIRDAIDKKLFG